MKRRGINIFILFFLFLFAILLVSANFEVGDSYSNYLTQKHYNPKENIRGLINLSFSEQSLNSIFEDSFGNKISLEKLLEVNPNFNYSCNTLECAPTYSLKDPEETKTFNLVSGEPKIIGFLIEGEEIIVNSMNFDLQSNVGASCENQIEIDLLDDNSTEWINDKSMEGNCLDYRTYGCFDKEETFVRHNIVGLPNLYCQRIEFPMANSFKIGAEVERNEESGNLTMALYNLNRNPLENAECILPKTDGEVYCEINYPITNPEEFYVCIYSTDGNGEATIKGYDLDNNSCGFYSHYSEGSAYSIFVEPKKFDSVGVLNVANNLMRGGKGTLASRINNYIENTYREDSPSKKYTIPLKISSKRAQTITLKNLEIDYYSSSGNCIESNFYDLDEIVPAKVNSDFQSLSLNDGKFYAPSSYGNYTFQLNLGSMKILSENISIEKISSIKYLTPTSVAYSVPTRFVLGVNYPTNTTEIEEYIWDFGDDEIERTSEREIIHTYPSSGNYELKVTIVDSRGFNSSRIFNIRVIPPDSIIRERIKRFQNNLELIYSEIENFPEFYQEQIESVLEIDNLEVKLRDIQKNHLTADTEEDYISIIEELSEFEIPNSIYKSREARDISLYPSYEKVNLDILEKIGGDSYEKNRESEYVDAIVLWNQENLEAKFDFDEITAIYGDYEEPILRIFRLNIQKSEDIYDKPYLIIKKMENLQFDDRYSEEEEGEYIYINLDRIEGIITFSTTEDIDFEELPAFISPEIRDLSLIKEPSEFEEEKNWGLFIWIIIALLIITFIVYIILQEWYNRKYETYLFKDRDNLFNILTYIKNSKKREMSDKEIISKLKKSGWNPEQIRYAMNKYKGKNTGMLVQIPIPLSKKLDKLFDRMFNKNKRIKKEKRSLMRRNISPRRIMPSRRDMSPIDKEKFRKYK